MQIYLTISGLLIILAVYNAEVNIRRAAACRNEALVIRDRFQPAFAGRQALLRYADQLKVRIETSTKQSKAIQEALPANIYTVLPLLNFLNSQSDGSSLNKLTMIQEHDRPPVLEFSLAVPTGGQKSPRPGGIQNWQKKPELAKCFTSITPVTTRLGIVGNREAFIVNYKAVFEE
jgi:hypothetical protein